MSKNKVYESQKDAMRRYRRRHPEKMSYLRDKSAAKSFLLKKATLEDLDVMTDYIAQRRRQLKED